MCLHCGQSQQARNAWTNQSKCLRISFALRSTIPRFSQTNRPPRDRPRYCPRCIPRESFASLLIDAKCRSPPSPPPSRPAFRVHTFRFFLLPYFSLSISPFLFPLVSDVATYPFLSVCAKLCVSSSGFAGIPSLDLPYSSSRYAARAFASGMNAGVRWAE